MPAYAGDINSLMRVGMLLSGRSGFGAGLLNGSDKKSHKRVFVGAVISVSRLLCYCVIKRIEFKSYVFLEPGFCL